MTFNKIRFAITAALTVSALWILCGLFVYLAPTFMGAMTGHMLHMESSAIELSITTHGMLMGLVGWAVGAALFGWLFAFINNFFARK